MTTQFGYLSERQMPPRPGVKFFTVYYLQSHAEYTMTKHFVVDVAKQLIDLVTESPDAGVWFSEPLPGYRKMSGGNYTPEDIVTDMVRQFSRQRDIPSGMYGRWRRLFADTPWDFELTQEAIHRPKTTFTGLFE